MKNWKTTLFGALAAVAGALTAFFPEQKELLAGLAGVFTALFAYFSKDSNVTGGTVEQTTK